MNGENHDGGRQRQGLSPRPYRNQRHQGGGRAAPDPQLAQQVKIPGLDAKRRTDSVIHIVDEIAPNRSPRSTDGENVKNPGTYQNGNASRDQWRDALPNLVPVAP